MLKREKGLTIIELLITIGIISLLSAILFLGRGKEEEKLALNRSAIFLSQEIREVQEAALGSTEKDCNGEATHTFGIYLEKQNPFSYYIFADCNTNKKKDSSDPILKEVTPEKGVKICSLSSDSLDISFSPPDPTTFINGQDAWGGVAIITLCLESDQLKTKKVKVNSVGMIEIE